MPRQTYRDYWGSEPSADIAAVGPEEFAPWWQEATGQEWTGEEPADWVHSPPPADMTAAEAIQYSAERRAEGGRETRAATAAEKEKDRELERWWRTEFQKFAYAELAANEKSQAADRDLKREALRADIAMNDKKLAELKASNRAGAKLAYGQAIGQYTGGPPRGWGLR